MIWVSLGITLLLKQMFEGSTNFGLNPSNIPSNILTCRTLIERQPCFIAVFADDRLIHEKHKVVRDHIETEVCGNAGSFRWRQFCIIVAVQALPRSASEDPDCSVTRHLCVFFRGRRLIKHLMARLGKVSGLSMAVRQRRFGSIRRLAVW